MYTKCTNKYFETNHVPNTAQQYDDDESNDDNNKYYTNNQPTMLIFESECSNMKNIQGIKSEYKSSRTKNGGLRLQI